MKEKEIDFDVLCRKAEELRAIFVLGQRLIPFLEDIFGFVSDIKPLLDDINVSIEENMNKMQNASIQLSKVTEATETATTKIIDTANDLINKSGIITANMKRLNELNSLKYENALNVFEIIQKAATEKKDINKYVSQLSDAMDKLKTIDTNEYKEIYESTGKLLDSINNNSSSIIMSLQVQDITSQQIAAVNHLLETIQDKLGHILMKFQFSEGSSPTSKKKTHNKTIISELHRPIAFNPVSINSTSSDLADNDDDTSYFSQEDIDALFGKQ